MNRAAWIEAEFARTGLPRSDLARYLGVDNAVVTRVAHGERALSLDEFEAVRSFFSVVPSSAEPRDVQEIRKLRSARARRAVGTELARCVLRQVIEPGDPDFIGILTRVADEELVLRADQIVAICRSAGLPLRFLPTLTAGDAVDSLGSFNLNSSARIWAFEEKLALPYNFAKGTGGKTRGKTKSAPSARTNLRPGHMRSETFQKTVPFLVEDVTVEPWFRRGQTIYLQDRSVEPRTGDFVALLLDRRGDQVSTIVGRLIFATNTVVRIEDASGQEQEIEVNTTLDLRRVGFCAF